MNETNPPTSEGDLKLIAGELVKMNLHLKLITGWMEGQEHITRAHTQQLLGVQEKMQLMYDIARPYGAKVDEMAICVSQMATTLLGVTELAKSTFEMVRDLKGGEHAGANETLRQEQAAAAP